MFPGRIALPVNLLHPLLYPWVVWDVPMTTAAMRSRAARQKIDVPRICLVKTTTACLCHRQWWCRKHQRDKHWHPHHPHHPRPLFLPVCRPMSRYVLRHRTVPSTPPLSCMPIHRQDRICPRRRLSFLHLPWLPTTCVCAIKTSRTILTPLKSVPIEFHWRVNVNV